MKDFRDLKVWRRAHGLAVRSYLETRGFPKSELYGLTSQIRRAAASVPANIAEGCGRGTDADFGRFLQIALGSASELEYHFLLSRELKFLEEEAYDCLYQEVTEVKRMLASLVLKLKADR